MNIPIREVEKICKSLKPVIGDKANALWFKYLAEDEKGKKELERLLQILSVKILNKNLQDERILLMPPTKEQASGEYPIGQVIYNDKEICTLRLKEEDFIRQIGIFSITGEGKTNIGMLLVLQLLKKKIPFMIIDWKRSWRNLLSLSQEEFPELKQLQVFTVGRSAAPFYWNPFREPPNVHYKTWLAKVTEVLESSHLAGFGVADIFTKIYDKKFWEFGFTKSHQERYPNFFDGMKELEKTKVYARELLWKQSASRVFKSFTFGPHASCFNSRNPVKLEELLEKPVILELDQELPKCLRTFFSEIILRWIHLYRISQGETEKLRHVLFIEEIHNLFPKTRIERETMSSLENVYREIRGFGQGLVSITQHTSLLPIYILGNCHTQITLGLQHGDDIRASKKSLFLEDGQEIYLDKLKVGEGIVKIKNRINPCYVRFPLVPIKKGFITDEMIKEKMQGYSAYSKPKEAKNEVITVIPHQDESLAEEVKQLLVDVFNFPLSGIAKRYQRIGLSVRKGNGCKHYLVSKNFVETKEIQTKTGRITLLQLTEKGKSFLKNLGYKVRNYRNGIEHKFWRWKVADYYKKKGYKVYIEKERNGKADIVVKNGNKTIAVEIETGKSDAIRNIQNDLAAGFDMIVSVATNKATEEKIKKELIKNNLNTNEKIKVISVKGFEMPS